MEGSQLWGWDAVNNVWRKCIVDDTGALIIGETVEIDDVPVDGATDHAISSNWAYDHYTNLALHVTNGNTHDHSGGDGAQINHTTLSNIGTNTHAQIDTYIAKAHGYTLESSASTGNPESDETFVLLPESGRSTTFGVLGIPILKAGTIKSATVKWYAKCTSMSDEDITIKLRLNNTTDYTIATIGSTSLSKTFANAALSIAVVAGDYFEIKIITPDWADPPLYVYASCSVFVEM